MLERIVKALLNTREQHTIGVVVEEHARLMNEGRRSKVRAWFSKDNITLRLWKVKAALWLKGIRVSQEVDPNNPGQAVLLLPIRNKKTGNTESFYSLRKKHRWGPSARGSRYKQNPYGRGPKW